MWHNSVIGVSNCPTGAWFGHTCISHGGVRGEVTGRLNDGGEVRKVEWVRYQVPLRYTVSERERENVNFYLVSMARSPWSNVDCRFPNTCTRNHKYCHVSMGEILWPSPNNFWPITDGRLLIRERERRAVSGVATHGRLCNCDDVNVLYFPRIDFTAAIRLLCWEASLCDVEP